VEYTTAHKTKCPRMKYTLTFSVVYTDYYLWIVYNLCRG